jgi:hypothetical protein
MCGSATTPRADWSKASPTRPAAEIATWPAIPPRSTWAHAAPDDEPDPVMTWQIRLDGRDYSLYSVMSSFGTPADITLSELTIELFFPADQATQDYLRSWSTVRSR